MVQVFGVWGFFPSQMSMVQGFGFRAFFPGCSFGLKLSPLTTRTIQARSLVAGSAEHNEKERQSQTQP